MGLVKTISVDSSQPAFTCFCQFVSNHVAPALWRHGLYITNPCLEPQGWAESQDDDPTVDNLGLKSEAKFGSEFCVPLVNNGYAGLFCAGVTCEEKKAKQRG